MKIPKTTESKPYVEFIFDKKGNLKLDITSTWWGENVGFTTSDGGSGSACLPEDLEKCLKVFKEKKIKEIEKKIKKLTKVLTKVKEKYGIL